VLPAEIKINRCAPLDLAVQDPCRPDQTHSLVLSQRQSVAERLTPNRSWHPRACVTLLLCLSNRLLPWRFGSRHPPRRAETPCALHQSRLSFHPPHRSRTLWGPINQTQKNFHRENMRHFARQRGRSRGAATCLSRERHWLRQRSYRAADWHILSRQPVPSHLDDPLWPSTTAAIFSPRSPEPWRSSSRCSQTCHLPLASAICQRIPRPSF
jgi:hypothetical protein